MLTELIVVIILQHVCISNHHVAHLKLLRMLLVNYISIQYGGSGVGGGDSLLLTVSKRAGRAMLCKATWGITRVVRRPKEYREEISMSL